MRITFVVVGHLDVRGGIKRVCEYATRLAHRGHLVEIMCDDREVPAWLPKKYFNGFNLVSGRGYTHYETDVAFATGGRAANRMARMNEARVKVYSVVMQESLNKPSFKRGQEIDRDKHLRDCFDQGWIYIANSSWLKDLVENDFGQKCHLVFGGINRDRLYPKDVPKAAPLSLLVYGRSEGWKGGARSAKAAELVDRQIRGTQIISYGQSKGPITHLPITHYRVPDQDQMADIYCSADIFLQSSQFEGFCNTAFESMACGVPVVTTDINGIEDFCVHEETALLVPVDDVPAMAEATIRLHKDKALYNKLRTNGLEMVERFDWDTEMEKLEEILQGALFEE